MRLPDSAEISESLHGAYLLARSDTTGYARFTVTADGFWRSFTAIVLIAPFYFAYATIEREIALTAGADGAALAAGSYFLERGIALLLDWFGFPLVMAVLAGVMGWGARYPLFVIAYNWSSVLVIAFLSPPFFLHGLGLIGAQVAVLFTLALTLAVIAYRWFIARTALEIGGLAAAGVVILDLALSLVINLGTGRLLGGA